MLRIEAEQETVLTAMGEELDAACCSLAKNGEDKLQVFCFVCCACLKLHLAISATDDEADIALACY